MTLIACPDCGQQVSSLSTACPSCGRQIAPMPAPVYYGYAPQAADLVAQKKQTVQLGYGLYAGGFIFGPLTIAALIVAYVNRGSVRGTWLESHYDWLIETFWVGIMAGVLGGGFTLFWIFAFFPIGFVLAMVVGLALLGWPIYRLVRGWSLLSEGQPATGSLSPPRW